MSGQELLDPTLYHGYTSKILLRLKATVKSAKETVMKNVAKEGNYVAVDNNFYT
jgi:Cys-tRNA synthase (O-phospho-L-seryl-tRNA:Cys-tRNA synthase)